MQQKQSSFWKGVDVAKTYYNFIPPAVIEDFVKNGDPFSKAGGFAIQAPILQPFMEKIEGAKDSVMGMPLALLEKLFTEVKD
jgi:predicted house-cleaning NTP pyrophosphatase (Maf/HAM1 superfamily)